MTDGPRELLHYHDLGSPLAIGASRFIAAALNLPYMRTSQWGTDVRDVPRLARETWRSAGECRGVLVEVDGLAALVELGGGGVTVRVAAGDEYTASEFVGEVRRLLPASVSDPGAPMIPVTFWSHHPMGARMRRRRISVPTWQDCMTHYPQRAFDALTGLMDDFRPGDAGQLLLWHGPPGTGKTYALRALGWEWRAWCDLHYITDPEVLFGESASYMLDVLLDHDDDGPVAVGDDEAADARADSGGRWRLLVLEDTGEMMSADARERAGQGLGRLLNVVDGLIGQGLRILVLVTTNEKITRLHPAVSRAGRCASSIMFDLLPIAEAREWLAAHGVDAPDEWAHDKPKAITIADLFAIRAGGQTEREPTTIGFAA